MSAITHIEGRVASSSQMRDETTRRFVARMTGASQAIFAAAHGERLGRRRRLELDLHIQRAAREPCATTAITSFKSTAAQRACAEVPTQQDVPHVVHEQPARGCHQLVQLECHAIPAIHADREAALLAVRVAWQTGTVTVICVPIDGTNGELGHN